MARQNKPPYSGPTYGIKLKDKVGYALGDTAGLLTFALVGSFLQMFYTDVLFIDPNKITILFFVARIWDAVNDPMMGAIIDRRKIGPSGKFRPFLRYGSVFLAAFAVLMFTEIPGLSENGYLVFAYISYILYGMAYTAVNIPYGSMASVITTDSQERSSLSMFRSIGAGLGGLPAQILLPMLVYTVSDEGVKYLDGSKLFIGVVILSVLSVIVYQLCYKMSAERVKPEPVQRKTKVSKTVKALLKNRPFLALCIASMLLIAVQQFTMTIYNYLFKDYFAKPELYSLVTVFTYLPMAILLPIMQPTVKKFGKKEACAAGMGLAFVANIVLLVLRTKSPAVFFVCCFVSGLGMSFFVLEVWALVTDVIDYQEILSGQRDEGTSYSFFSFTRKLGQTLAGVLGTQVLSWIEYDAKTVSTEAVTEKMYTWSAALPAIMCLGMALSLGLWYNLSKKKLEKLKPEFDKIHSSSDGAVFEDHAEKETAE